MTDLTPEQERKIAVAFLGEENFRRYQDAKNKKHRFVPVKTPPLRAEFFPKDNWSLELLRGNDVVKRHKYLNERTVIRMVRLLRRKNIPVKRFYFDWERRGKEKRQDPSRKQTVLSQIGNIKL